MKKILLIFGLLIFSCSFAQKYETDTLIMERRQVDSVNIVLAKDGISSSDLEYLMEAQRLVKPTIESILKLEDFQNEKMQDVLLNPLSDYHDAFNYGSKEHSKNFLRFGFDDKEKFIKWYQLAERLLLNKIRLLQSALIIKKNQAYLAKYEVFLNRNLKRLGMTRAQFEALSDNDVEILEKQFE